MILSTLYHMEKLGLITSEQRHDEYLRFSSMLQRLIDVNGLSSSVKLILFNHQEDHHQKIGCSLCATHLYSEILSSHLDADFQSCSSQIIDDINHFYQLLMNQSSSLSVSTRF
jgi:hypothetical protein